MHAYMHFARAAMVIRNLLLRFKIVHVSEEHEHQAAQHVGKDLIMLSNSTTSPQFGAALLREVVMERDVILGDSTPVMGAAMQLLCRLQELIYCRRAIPQSEVSCASLELAILPASFVKCWY